MQINHCLILAAGFGTRMGKIGQSLPKVLWPVFEKPLLELQVAYAKSLGIPKIYINLHFMGDQIEEWCRGRSAFEGVEFIWERGEILDIGGAIHNLASLPQVKYKGKLLVLNADQFFYLDQDYLKRSLAAHSKASVVLFNYLVNSSLGYNAVQVDGSRLMKSIIPNKELPSNSTVETYTGISIVDLSKLTKVVGVSNFFVSVCDYKKQEIPTVLLENIDYWDFGTLRRYWETMHRILALYRVNSNHPFLRFLVAEKALKTWKINLQVASYHAKGSRVINLNPDEDILSDDETIIIRGKVPKSGGKGKIWYEGVCEEIKS
jgi:choline kinase